MRIQSTIDIIRYIQPVIYIINNNNQTLNYRYEAVDKLWNKCLVKCIKLVHDGIFN